MQKTFLIFVGICFSIGVRSQYYYNDIVTNQQTRDNFQLLKKNAIKRIHVSSQDPDETPTQGFSIDQKIEGNEVTTFTKATYTSTSVLVSTHGKFGWVVGTVDSTDASVATTTFTYNDAFQLIHLVSATHENGAKSILYAEEKTYTYTGTLPSTMQLIKNKKDTTNIKFVTEEHGLVGEERWYKKGRLTNTYYYYYDAQNRLTDIARFNWTAKKILPDYTFEYSPQGKLITMKAYEPSSQYYRTWQYAYEERGLKTSETVHNKYRQLEGKVIYGYK